VRSVEALVAELEGALRRMGRPLAVGATLAGFEQRVFGSPDAAAYVRALRVARFGGADDLPTRRQRRALRRELRLGRGLLGALLALWALPPRWGGLAHNRSGHRYSKRRDVRPGARRRRAVSQRSDRQADA
jgi:hypothetical protein